MAEKLILAVKIILFIIFVALVIGGQRHIGYGNLALMLLGLAGLLGLLYAYNRKYK